MSGEALAAACACDDRSRTHSRNEDDSHSLHTIQYKAECTCKAEEVARTGTYKVIIIIMVYK